MTIFEQSKRILSAQKNHLLETNPEFWNNPYSFICLWLKIGFTLIFESNLNISTFKMFYMNIINWY